MKKLLTLFVISLIFFNFNLNKASANGLTELNSQIIKSFETDLTGDGKMENIILSGVNVNDSPLYENIKITVSDNKTGATLFSIIPTTNFGYEPTIMLGDFTGNGLNEVYYSSSSGDGGGYFYLFTFDEDYKLLYDHERDFDSFKAVYKDWYKLKVYDKDNVYYIDISNKEKELNSIYSCGKLISDKMPKISSVTKVFPYYDYELNVYNLAVVRKITTENGVKLCDLIKTYSYLNSENTLINSNVIV